MKDEVDLRAIARRAARRVMAGEDPSPSRRAEASVDLDGGRPGDGAFSAAPSPHRSPLVTADCLDGVGHGDTFPLPVGARVTPLAQEEAFNRGVRFVPAGTRAGIRRVAVGCDHGGRALKADVLASLAELGYAALDLGTHDDGPCDYPDYAAAVARAVLDGRADVGVVIDGAGIGSAMAACKLPGILAANCWDERTARNAREHNHANVLTLGAGHLDRAAAHAVLAAFLGTPPGPERHARRVAKIHALGPPVPVRGTGDRA